MLVRLLYASRAAEAVTQDIIESILASSRQHNPALGITGVLCHGGDVYMQVLEGGRDAVNALYNKIVRDSRHRDIALLHYEEVAERKFAGWTMGQVNLTKVNPSLLLKYSGPAGARPLRRLRPGLDGPARGTDRHRADRRPRRLRPRSRLARPGAGPWPGSPGTGRPASAAAARSSCRSARLCRYHRPLDQARSAT